MRFPQRFPIISPPFTAGSAPTCDGALALRHGSDLLPLRLLSHCRSGDARAPPDHGAFGLCHAPGTPRRRTVLSRDRVSWTRSPSGGGPPANDPCGDWLVSSNQYPLGNCIWSPGRNLPAPMTRLGRGFSSRLAAMFPDRINRHVRPRRRKPVKYAFRISRLRSIRKGLAPPVGTNLCSVTRVYPEIAPESHAHSPAQFVLSKNLL